MTSIIPELDDIEFATLVEDGRGLIPGYAPDWTDHNLHDPGITLIDLIAWLVDQQVYRTGFVGDSLRTAFTRLMGIAPRGPKAAEVLVWPRDGTLPILDLEEGTNATTPDIVEAEFTLAARVRTTEVRISDIRLVSGAKSKSLGIGLTQGRDPTTIQPFSGGGPRALEFTLSAAIKQVAGAGPVSLGIALTSSGFEASQWDPLTIEQEDPGGFWHPLKADDRTGGFATTGILLFEPSPLSPATRFRLRLDRGFRPAPITLTRLGLNVLPLREGRDAPEQVIGQGNGLPDQRFDFESDDIVDRETTLKVLTGADAWELVTGFDVAGPNERHVLLSSDGLVFGNGLNGSVVPRGAQVRVAPLRRTLGTDGAVAKDLNWDIAGQLYGSNIAPSTTGRDRDTLTELARRARQVAKRREGVLHSDVLCERLLSAGLGLERVQIMPRRRPGLEGAEASGSRTVLILPARDPAMPPEGAIEGLRGKVSDHLTSMRLLGERIYVSPPIYVRIDVAVELVAEADADLLEMRATAEAAIYARLWDIARAPNQIIRPWQAGRDVTVGEIEGMMSQLDQVVQVPDCRIARAGQNLSGEKIALGDREIALAETVEVRVIRATEGGQV